MRSALLSSALLLTMAWLLAACSFSVDRPEQFKTVDNGKDVSADVGDPDVSPTDNGPDAPPPTCSNDGDCPVAEEMCFTARCVDGECSNQPDKGADCEDGNACTKGDTCNINGDCKPGAVKECSPSGDPCIAMECIPESGKCEGFAVPGCNDCASFGEEFVLGEWECCPEWSEAPFCIGFNEGPLGENSCECDEAVVICLNCGDGACEEPENECNCEADCGLPQPQCEDIGGQCFDEFCPPDGFEIPDTIGCDEKQLCCMSETKPCLLGGDVGFKGGGDECCEQFDPIPFGQNDEGDCKPDESMFVCAKCGDQKCQVEWAETVCNCPEDCFVGDCGSDGDCPEGKTCFKGECKYCTPEICNGLDDDCDGDIDEQCQEVCFAEICGDGLDNDCDDTKDEAVCVKDWCPSELPPVYLKAPLHKLFNYPDDFVGQPVAVSGRVGAGAGVCVGEPGCVWPLVLEEQGVLPANVVVGSSQQYGDVGCISADQGLLPDTGGPMAKNKTYIAWGLFTKSSDGSSGYLLSLHGFCKP